MTNQDTNILGNTSTIIKTVCMWISGYAIGYFISIGLNLPVNQEELAELIFIIITTLLAYIDAKYHNTYFNKTRDYPSRNTQVEEEE